jgi:hypothetical protein
MITSEQCKAYAAECRQLADTVTSPEHTKILLELAGSWDDVCKQLGRLEGHKPVEGQN